MYVYMKSLLMNLKEESKNAGLKHNIQKNSGPITSWQIDGETLSNFIFLVSKITADSDCSQEIKRHLLLGRKAVTNQDSVLKSKRHYFADKDLYNQSYDFSSSHVCM